MDHQPALKQDNEDHSLLEPPSIAYSSATVRRAFAVWMYCGQTNKFQHVCNYYHYLEALEETLSEESRAASRQHELNLFTSRPPLSSYLINNFPTLYPAAVQQITRTNLEKNKQNTIKKQNTTQQIENTGTSKAEILETSIMIRDYCRRNMKSLKVFLKEFKEHTTRCGLNNTVGNIVLYIKRKTITSEIQLEANYAKTLELMTRNYEGAEDVDNISNEGELLNESEEFNSLILKKTNSLTTTVDKKNSEIKKKSTKIFDSEINEVNIVKMYKIDKIKYDNKENMNSKDSNLIMKEDFMKARKI